MKPKKAGKAKHKAPGTLLGKPVGNGLKFGQDWPVPAFDNAGYLKEENSRRPEANSRHPNFLPCAVTRPRHPRCLKGLELWWCVRVYYGEPSQQPNQTPKNYALEQIPEALGFALNKTRTPWFA